MASNIVVRKVYRDNVDYEFNLIQQSSPLFPYASINTSFPGIVFHPHGVPDYLLSTLPPASFYKVMKENVDALDLIQVGLTLSDANGNLPSFGTRSQFVWEFNFRDFDYEYDLRVGDSISLLERQGVDFKKNREDGIDSHHFAHLFRDIVVGKELIGRPVTWVTIHGAYGFGFLIKILTQRKLPDDMDDFLTSVRYYFGTSVFDVKILSRLLGLHGGLDCVAGSLKLDRVAGKAHQAGSDSLLTMHVFHKLTRRWSKDMRSNVDKKSLMFFGLTTVN